MTTRNFSQSVEISITSFSKKGHGLGHILEEAKRTVEVPFTLPGDKVRACLMRKRGGVYSSRLEEILVESPLRIKSRCVHFASCGGCKWQNLEYQDQLKIKQESIEKLFQPLLPPGIQIQPIVACDPPWHYRNKMEFSFSNDASGRQFLGLILDGSRGKVFNLTECHLVNPWFAQTLHAMRTWWHESGLRAYHPYTNTGSLRTLTLREGMRTGDRLVMLTVSGNPDFALQRQHIDSFVTFLRDAIEPGESSKLSIFLRIQQIAKGMETNFYEMHLYGPDHIGEILHIQPVSGEETESLTFNVSPSAFFQPNAFQAEKLYSCALQMLDIPFNSTVYDLFCGTGTLGICASRLAKNVIGIEISPESSLDARANATANGKGNVSILTGSVRDVISMIRKEKTYPLPDIVMVDPPRAGLDAETLQHLAELKPDKILYISCNPVTQADNMKKMIEMGYEIAGIRPVDQFPHTVHIENIVILKNAR